MFETYSTLNKYLIASDWLLAGIATVKAKTLRLTEFALLEMRRTLYRNRIVSSLDQANIAIGIRLKCTMHAG